MGVNPTASVVLGDGNSHQLSFDINRLIDLEDAYGDLREVFPSASAAKGMVRRLRHVLAVAAEVSEEEAGELLTGVEPNEIVRILSVLMAEALGRKDAPVPTDQATPVPAETPSDPTPVPAGTPGTS